MSHWGDEATDVFRETTPDSKKHKAASEYGLGSAAAQAATQSRGQRNTSFSTANSIGQSYHNSEMKYNRKLAAPGSALQNQNRLSTLPKTDNEKVRKRF